MFLSLKLEERTGGGVIFLETLHTGKRNGNKKFFFSAWCLIFELLCPLEADKGVVHMGSVYSRASASHCISPGSSVLTLCLLFPRLISNPNVAGGGVITRAAPICQSLSCRLGMLASIQHVLSLAASVAPCWLSAAGREGRGAGAAPGVPRALSWQVAPLSCRSPKAALLLAAARPAGSRAEYHG